MSQHTTEQKFASHAALRAISHPLRLDIIEYLRRNRHARAADIAEETGVPANSVSYHLRTLAAAELVAEAPELARDKRDRVWRLTAVDTDISADISKDSPEYRGAIDQVGLAGLEWLRAAWLSRVTEPLANERGEPYAGLTIATARMTPAEAGQLMADLAEVVNRYTVLHRDDSGRDLEEEGESVLSYRLAVAAISHR